MNISAAELGAGEKEMAGRVVRHRLVDRVYHWTMAASVLTLLVTAFLPIVGWKFPWITPHWIAGVILTLLVAFHIVRALFWQDLRSMMITLQDMRDACAATAFAIRRTGKLAKPGKYILLQKVYHLGAAVFVLALIATGCLMLLKIDTPWWKRRDRKSVV